MNFLKVKKFRKASKLYSKKEIVVKPVPEPEEPKIRNGLVDLSEQDNADLAAEDDDDDDFITNEVKRRLKELRRNSFMVLIPEEEESCAGEEEEEEGVEEGETSSSEWRDVEAEGRQWWRGFDAVYEKYCERMLFLDKLSLQRLNELGKVFECPSTPSPRSASKKLTSPFRCLSLKNFEGPDNETEHLQQPDYNPNQDIEMAYVGQICLTWETLHSQYTQIYQKMSFLPDYPACYNHSAQQFQQFQVLLQRFIENEPFEQGLRAEIYARSRKLLPMLLQVPNIQGLDQQVTEDDTVMKVLAPDLIRIIENSILTFRLFLKMERKRSNGVLNLFGNHNQLATPLQQIQVSLEKKATKLKELRKKSKGWKKKSWHVMPEDVQLLLGLIDVKVLSRVLRMVKITKEQLFWCEEKMKKLYMSDGKLHRDPNPILFPC